MENIADHKSSFGALLCNAPACKRRFTLIELLQTITTGTENEFLQQKPASNVYRCSWSVPQYKRQQCLQMGPLLNYKEKIL